MQRKLTSIVLCALMLTAFFGYVEPRDKSTQVIEDCTTIYDGPENEKNFDDGVTFDLLENDYVTGSKPTSDTTPEYGSIDDAGIPLSNQPPVADAGPDRTVNEGDVVQFDGSNSKGSTSGAGQVWTKYVGNPVLDLGPSGSWDDAYVTHPSVLYDGTTYHMWYSGYDSSNWRIGYAHSTDGITWIKNPSNPLIDLGAPGSWEDAHVTHPIVLYDGTKYHMWYSGQDGWTYRIGYASSSDGIAWVKYSGNPVLDCGLSGSWEDTHVTHPTVLYDGTKYHMWYTGHDGSRYRIGYAYSSDGTTWLKSAANPVFKLGSSGSWDDFHVYGPSIIYDGITYSMWYSGHDGSNWRIGYATSSDGITWTRDGSNPVLDIGPPGSWEDVGVHSPTVLFSGGFYHMWYRGFSGTNVRIGYAYSSAGGQAQIISYEWDFESDGIYDYQETASNAPDGAFDGKTIHIYGDNGMFKVTLRVTDDTGLNDTNTCNVTVNNVAPMVGPITAQGVTSIAQDVIEEWVARYNSPGDYNDWATDIVVDSSGNVYVTGGCVMPTWDVSDYITIKYDSSGNELWVQRYNGPGNKNDYAFAIALDSYENVYVTGRSHGGATDYDYATIKYDSLGNELWVARYNGPENMDDQAFAIAIDNVNNVYITGISNNRLYYPSGSRSHYDYATVAYDSSGNELWVARYDGPDIDDDKAEDMVIDDLMGRVYVTGQSKGIGTEHDYATIAYDFSGNELWVARYNGPGNSHDCSLAMAVDLLGNIYVTGVSIGNGTEEDFATVKYDSSGNELWVRRYNGPGNLSDVATDIALDPLGNVYVTGGCGVSPDDSDFVTIKYDSDGNELWVSRYDVCKNEKEFSKAIAIDLSENIYVTGVSLADLPPYEYDYATVAYDTYGNRLWSAKYNGPGNDWDETRAIAIDSFGNIYVTGYSKGNGTGYDYATIKYSILSYYEYPEGSSIIFTANGSDPGSDDLTFTWNWGDGTTDTVTTYYNDGTGPEPVYDSITNEIKSPWGTYPFNATDTVSHIYGDNGEYTVTLTVEDDDGGATTYPITVKVNNVEPTIEPFGPFTIYESSPIDIMGIASDPGSDDLSFTWTFEYGPTITNEYYNDGAGPDPYPSPGGIFPFSATDTVGHTYGDNGVFIVILTVEDDDGGISVYKTNITVSNINPNVTIVSVTMNVEIGLRVAGRKYNNVSMTLYEEGNPIGYVSIERMPGSPNDQMAWIPIILDMTKTYNATVIYTPEDPPNVGGNPVWIYIKFQNGSLEKIHHTFNVQQSKKRDSDHWNHVEPWEVNINAYLIGHSFEITSHITDPGSDDEILTFTYVSQAKTVTYLNNPPNPDPFPSPEVKPVDIIDNTTLIYEGPGTLTLLVEDDDGGTTTTTIDLS